jgi:dipeptidyl aminopeptidase/acylaminoacyl peptidase
VAPRTKAAAVALLVAAASVVARAQSPALDRELKRIFQTNDYAGETFGPSVWLDNGRSYGLIERAGDSRARILVAYDTATGAREVLADSALLTPRGASGPLAVAGYTWSLDGQQALLFNRVLANEGYVVLSFDNRGTPAPKGTAWRKVVSGTVGDLSSKEQAAAVRAFSESHPFVDRDRIGIWGWSGGGSNTLNAMFRFPDVFKVGVSVAPVPDQRLYDTIYQERYMGLPQTNAEGLGSPINFAEGLAGKLLIVHGSGDDNVHYQSTERLVNRLVELGKPFDLMAYPNRTHAISEGPGTSLHVHSLIARYFIEHLPAGARP